jgi:three-Cys-motif partner protein
VPDLYHGREQTKAKHFILKRYLQALAFKVMNGFDLTYVDGFSGPWETRAPDFADSSFKIAISVLQDAQEKLFERTGRRRRVRCFFSEANPVAFEQLRHAVAPFHDPARQFEIRTYCGRFEDAVVEMQEFIGTSFPLIFIDPTGWTGYPFDKIKPLFARPRCEVLINFMYDFVNRFASSDDPETIASLDPILGGPGWRSRLDERIARGPAVEKLFRQTLEKAGGFDFVVSTKIDKATVERPHFFIAYGTKSHEGLKAFRETEYTALKEHSKNRGLAKERRREEKTGSIDLFAGYDGQVEEASLDVIIEAQIASARRSLVEMLKEGSLPFAHAVARLLRTYMLRETNVKDLCVALAKEGVIQNTWRDGSRKPNESHVIHLMPLTPQPTSAKATMRPPGTTSA